ncbi:glycoside hydrolase family 13 protein [Inconstantimicrobium porci]|uniref:Alpha-glycosidase n=1 Tax=Inconstantimicrobium porci TaxID=2652291 RepID=A0A7X2N0D3_9CLOT|nr:glycoside hydrolase family 13 protein [Inconstantimicrobium porci]MSR92378.1 alpha-glycosidase [Inconstantimicrobium porci]
MNLSAIYHESKDNYCYPLNENELVINIKTGYDVDRVILYYGDPFKGGIMGGDYVAETYRIEVAECKKLQYHKFWSVIVKPEFKRCKYYFELIAGSEHVFYIEGGFMTEDEFKSHRGMRQDFFFPWMNKADVNFVPNWVKSTIWYQIFPDRFCNGDETINPENVKEWALPNQSVKNSECYGGDLQGIINKLDYLKELGITGIYMTPINVSKSNHKYDTTDYYKIDTNFGDKQTMQKLVSEAHKRNIRIMLDGVFNHCGEDFPVWQDVVKNGPKSKYFNWFMINEWPFNKGYNAMEGKYYTFAFEDYMPKLNTNNPEVINYLLDVCTYWVNEYDIDALRLDVANEISHEFCKKLKERMLSLKSDFYIVGEIWHNSMKWLRGDEFDSVMNYPLKESIDDFWLNKNTTRDDFEHSINRCYSMYMKQTNDVLFNLLDSHDTIRLVTELGDIDKFYQQMAVLFTMPGTTCIFYGTEVALEGKHDPDCRRCMPWNEIKNGDYNDRIEIMKTLIRLRKEKNAFRSSNICFTKHTDNERILSYIKKDDKGEDIEVILNCSDEDIIINKTCEVIFSRLYDGKVLKQNGFIIIKR